LVAFAGGSEVSLVLRDRSETEVKKKFDFCEELRGGESMNVFTPHDGAQNSIRFDKSNPLWAKLDADRGHVTVEICYCSTLGECWTLRAGGLTDDRTTETRRCPTQSDITFQ